MVRRVLLLVAICLLSSCTGTTFTWNSELTLHFKTPDGPVVEASVTLNEYWICDRRCINPGHTGTTVSSRTYGEAIAARLGDTYVFALVGGAAHGRQAHLDAFADRGLDTQRQWIKAISRNRDVLAVVPLKLYPKLVAFKDTADPTTIYQIDPNDLTAALGIYFIRLHPPSRGCLPLCTLCRTDPPLKLLILSDLHADFWSESGRDPFKGLKQHIGELDHLILAGDISNKPKVRWKFAFERLSDLLPLGRVSVFPGNHDFYDFRFDGEDRLQEIATSFGVQYAQKKQLNLEGVRILCATLWTDFEIGAGSVLNAKHVATQMNDYKKIRVAERGYRKLRPSDVLARHRDHRRWLESVLASPFDGRTFVATHHAPHPDAGWSAKRNL